MPIEPAPPVFNIRSIYIQIRAYDESNSQYVFKKNITPDLFNFGNSDSHYIFKIRISDNNINEYFYYNNPDAQAGSDTYYYDLRELTANNSTMQLQNTKTLAYVSLLTISYAGTNENRETATMDLSYSKINSGSLVNKLCNKNFSSN